MLFFVFVVVVVPVVVAEAVDVVAAAAVICASPFADQIQVTSCTKEGVLPVKLLIPPLHPPSASFPLLGWARALIGRFAALLIFQ